MLTLLLCLFAYALGANLKRLKAMLETLAETIASPLPNTSMLGLYASQPIGHWAIAGEYLIKDNGVTRNVYLTRYARWLMGENADVVLLTPFRHKVGYVDTTPTGGQYVRFRKTVSYRAYVVSYWFPESPAYSTVGQSSWACEVIA